MADDAPLPRFPLLSARFVAKAVPEPHEPFEYPATLAPDGGGTEGAAAGVGTNQAETSFAKCRKFLAKSDKTRAEEWKDGIQTQLLVVRVVNLFEHRTH